MASYGATLQLPLAGLVSTPHAKRHPGARDVACLGANGLQHGRAVSAEQALPVYLRNEVTLKKSRK